VKLALEWNQIMLVLSRKLQQQIVIPGLDIRITVLSVGTNRVQLGIDAPRGIQITRPELSAKAAAPLVRPRLTEANNTPCDLCFL
jgi:carbon storage regulator CsrA